MALRFILALASLLSAAAVRAEEPLPLEPLQAAMTELLEQMVLESLPEEYDERKDWGQTKEITVGYKLRTGGGKLRMEKRRTEVNDGLWRRYSLTLLRPEKNLSVRLLNLHRTPGGRLAGEARLKARVAADARQSQWTLGIRNYSISLEAKATVELILHFEVGLEVVPKGYFLAMAVRPKVTDVEVKLLEFELDRISKVGGWVADEIGEELKGTVQRKLNRREEKFAAKINRSIEKRQDRLIFSPQDFLRSPWASLQSDATPTAQAGQSLIAR